MTFSFAFFETIKMIRPEQLRGGTQIRERERDV